VITLAVNQERKEGYTMKKEKYTMKIELFPLGKNGSCGKCGKHEFTAIGQGQYECNHCKHEYWYNSNEKRLVSAFRAVNIM
jgi:ribosomal protein L37AE/L43A